MIRNTSASTRLTPTPDNQSRGGVNAQRTSATTAAQKPSRRSAAAFSAAACRAADDGAGKRIGTDPSPGRRNLCSPPSTGTARFLSGDLRTYPLANKPVYTVNRLAAIRLYKG